VLSAASEGFMDMSSLQFVDDVSLEIVQMKLLLMIFIFVYGFFTFSWALRQYGFCFILFGSSFNTVRYYKGDKEYQAQAVPRDFKAVAKVLDRAAHSYNYGIRAYYFAMAALAWFINDWCFIAACAVIIFVLYRREFKSSSLQAMVDARQISNVHDEDEIKFD
jgi:uncharacterized membrane protein